MDNEGEKRRAARSLIRRKRLELGLTRRSASILTGLSVTTHTKIETGWRDKDSTMGTLKVIAANFGIEIMELISLYKDRWDEDLE